MTDNSKARKKALIVSVLLFLAAGGGVFIFFVIQGSNDLTGANKKNSFTFGGAARDAATSFFKFVGFEDVDSIAKEGPKDRPRIKEYEAAGMIDSAGAGAASSSGGEMPWASSAGGGRSASPSYVPKMAGRGGSSVGGLGGAGTRSSAEVSRFGGGGDAGNTRVTTAKPHEAADGIKGSGTLTALAKSRAMLGDGLRSGSAMTAKSKWDASFGVGRTGASGGGELAYGKTGLVNLDKIKKGEVDNLKTTDPKSLKVPEVGKPEYAGDGKGGDGKGDKESAADAMNKSMAASMFGAMGQGLSKPLVSDKGGGDMRSLSEDPAGGSSPGLNGSCQAGSTAPLCNHVDGMKVNTDTNISYRQIGTTADGPVVQITYSGSGPGITPEYKSNPDVQVDYHDTVNAVVDPKTGEIKKIIGWFDPIEKPSPGGS